ncbi:MAG: AarF/ABC1/UbiB kinase family protein [Candidatus Brocadiae bacterium]|nr:AarF/ABC1/UbiB kinase family protein [Candidatus Brocadiia bacterium]
MTFISTLFRFLKILFYLLPTIIRIYLDRKYYFFLPRWEKIPADIHRQRAKSLRKKLSLLGPTFIKFGQILSTREDFMPYEYIEELSQLQDKVPPVSFKKIKKLLDAEWGKDSLSIFESIDPVPLASASLAQVHIASLQGKKVVLKILRPGVEGLIQCDLKILPLIGAIIQTFTNLGQTNTLINAISEFSRVIRKEIYFPNELKNIELFRKNFNSNPNIIIPFLYKEHCTSRILVMEYIYGCKISDVQKISSLGISPKSIVDTLVKCYLDQVLLSGFFHADPHPGNLLISPEGKVVFLDFGMMIHFPKHLQRLIIRASIAGAQRNLDELIKILIDLGIFDPQANQEALKKIAKKIIAVFDKKSHAEGVMKIKYMIQQFHRIAQDFSITLPPYLVYLFKASGEVEGICMRFIPEFTGISYASPFVREMAQEILKEEKEAIADDILQKTKILFLLPLQIQKVLDQLEEERIRVRMHPREIRDMEAIMAFNARRVLFGILAGVISITTAILYIELHSNWLMIAGFTIATILGTGSITMPARLHLEWARNRSENDTFDENF